MMKLLSTFLSTMTTAEKFVLSGEMLLRGLGTVFLVLLLLWGILSLFNVVFGSRTGEKKAASVPVPKLMHTEEKPAPVKKNAETLPETKSAPMEPAEDTGALIAAITAAVEAYRAEEAGGASYALPFRVVSFKRRSASSGWNGASNEN